MTESIGNFDEVADTYSDQLATALGVFGGESDYFARYKVELISHTLKDFTVGTILDYGSGIGTSIPFFREFFPSAQIWATDLSSESLSRLKTEHPEVNIIQSDGLNNQKFDLVFLSCVVHHMPVNLRAAEIDKVLGFVRSEGHVCVFEHNPFNPITRRIVSNCAFDEGVVLLSRRGLRRLFSARQGPIALRSGYCLFFPPIAKRLAFIERVVRWLPLGGQHYLFVQVSNSP